MNKKLFLFIDSTISLLHNHLICHLPCRFIRNLFYWLVGMKFGRGTKLDMNQYILCPYRIKIGSFSHINQGCFLDARSRISIGNSVSISHYVRLVTGSHNIQDKHFSYKGSEIVIHDFAWIGIGVTILQGVTIGKGAVVCAGAVVTKDVEDFSIVAGIPAKKIGERNKELNYICSPEGLFQ